MISKFLFGEGLHFFWGMGKKIPHR